MIEYVDRMFSSSSISGGLYYLGRTDPRFESLQNCLATYWYPFLTISDETFICSMLWWCFNHHQGVGCPRKNRIRSRGEGRRPTREGLPPRTYPHSFSLYWCDEVTVQLTYSYEKRIWAHWLNIVTDRFFVHALIIINPYLAMTISFTYI